MVHKLTSSGPSFEAWVRIPQRRGEWAARSRGGERHVLGGRSARGGSRHLSRSPARGLVVLTRSGRAA